MLSSASAICRVFSTVSGNRSVVTPVKSPTPFAKKRRLSSWSQSTSGGGAPGNRAAGSAMLGCSARARKSSRGTHDHPPRRLKPPGAHRACACAAGAARQAQKAASGRRQGKEGAENCSCAGCWRAGWEITDDERNEKWNGRTPPSVSRARVLLACTRGGRACIAFSASFVRVVGASALAPRVAAAFAAAVAVFPRILFVLILGAATPA